jgi:hypothetical protein
MTVPSLVRGKLLEVILQAIGANAITSSFDGKTESELRSFFYLDERIKK